MSNAPDPAQIHDPGLPRDPAEYGLRRRGLGVAFWAAIAFGFICILAGAAIGRFGAQWFPVSRSAASAGAASPGAPVQPQSPATPGEIAPAPAPGVTAAVTAPAPPPVPAAELAALGARLDRLQADQRRAALASGEALAAAALSEASQSSRRFDDQLAGLDRLLPDTSDLRTLRALAQTGAPSRPALASEFASVADRVAVASHAPPPGASVMARLAHALASVFTVRRIDRLTGSSPDAVLARAQRRVEDGDLEDALKELDALPQTGRDALGGWRARASRRIEIDRLVADIRVAAVRDLASARETAP